MFKSILQILFIVIICVSSAYPQLQNFQKFPHTQNSISYEYSVLLETTDNRLALIYLEENNLKFSKSDLDWVNWNTPVILVDSIENIDSYFDLNAIVTSTGKILISYKAGRLISYNYFSSVDNGNTWSEQQVLQAGVNINSSRFSKSLSFNKIQSAEIWCTYKRSTSIFSIKSYDDGETWGTENLIVLDYHDEPYPNVNKVNNGNLILTYLESLEDGRQLYGRISSDSGQTWGEKYLISDYGDDILRLESAKNNLGQITLSFQTELPLLDPQYKQTDVIYIKSADGVSWTAPTRFTKNLQFDGNSYLSAFGSKTLISFSSERENINKQLWYGEIGVTEEVSVPPIIINYSHEYDGAKTIQFEAVVLDNEPEINVSLNYTVNDISPTSVQMYDDGTHGDSTANDFIFINNVFGLPDLQKISYSITAVDNDSNSIQSDTTIFFMPSNIAAEVLLIDVNNIKMPIDNRGNFADASIDGTLQSRGGKYDDIVFLFSGGFYLSGLNNDEIWSNGMISSSLTEDYLPGLVGTDPNSPTNLIYQVSSSDQHFSTSWQLWQNAVEQGANFYDGNNDGLYNPVDLNSNGIWDSNEDRPDLIGDRTYFCVFNDGVPKEYRVFNEVDPLGIEIRQTVYASSGISNEYLSDIIFVRNEIENTGLISNRLDSVYFAVAQDPDIGDVDDDLVGSDIELRSSYSYNDSADFIYVTNPPASFISLLQGPPVYIPGTTFIDNNSDGEYSAGTDTPLDSAFAKLGPYLGEEIIEGAANDDITAFMVLMSGDPDFDIPDNRFEVRNYIMGKDLTGNIIDIANFNYGNGSSLGADTAGLDPRILFSGDPVTNTGWLNTIRSDQRTITSTGPFNLITDEPVEIIYAYIVGRGTDALNSITVAREINQYAHNLYHNNFSDMLTQVKDKNNLTDLSFELYQNYPNPFNPVTTIKFTTSPFNPSPYQGEGNRERLITLKVYDILGREVQTLVNEQKPAGTYEIQFDASKLASGVYFYQLTAGSFVQTKKLMLLK